MDDDRHSIRRHQMVEYQLAARGIHDQRVLAVMEKVPRHCFVPQSLVECAYDDKAQPIDHHQTISQPYMVARMTEDLAVEAGHRVLEIGTGSGYQTAILAELAATVYTVERVHELLDSARARLLAYQNIQFHCGDGTQGLAEHAPFDRILVTAAAPQVPAPLVEQLAEEGRLVVPVGTLERQQVVIIDKRCGQPVEQTGTPCVFVKLIGQDGWPSGD